MTFPKEIEHGGYPTSETRTIFQMRRDADAYAGIGVKGRRAGKAVQLRSAKNSLVQQEDRAEFEAKKVVDTGSAPEVILPQSPIMASTEPVVEPAISRSRTMTLTLKGYSKNGKNAFYTGAAIVLRFPLSAFVDKVAPASDPFANLAPAKQPKVKLTKEERKALQAAKPKPTEAERIAKAEAALAKRKAKLAASATAASL